jgi:antirestriction protein ArdC
MENSVKTATANNVTNVNPRREELKALSNSLKPVAQENQTTINAALVFYYSEQTGVPSQDFKTLEAWNNLGYIVKKGEKSFAIWGQLTKKTINLEEGRIAGEPNVIEFFPIVSLFSIDQVRKKEPRQAPQRVEITAVKTQKTRKGKESKAVAAQA